MLAAAMPLKIKVKPSLGLASLHKITEQLSSPETAPDKTMARLVACAHTLRQAAHLARTFGPWLPTLPTKEQTAVAALLGRLTVESADVGDGCLDDHGGYRGEVLYSLAGSARVVGVHHFFGYNNDAMFSSTSLSFEDRGPSLAARKAAKKAPKKLANERLFLEAPADLAPAADLLFAFLGPESALSRETRIRFLLRLLFPWGRYQRGYEGAGGRFYADADRLYALTPAKRAAEIAAREDDGEVIPFFLG
jgi:hypothetical protein